MTGYDDIAAILRNDDDFSARDHKPRAVAEMPPDIKEMLSTWSGESASLGEMDPPDHTRVRSVINAGFTPRALKAAEADIRAAAAHLLQPLTAASEFDLITEFALPYALTVILRFLGIPAEHHEACLRWSDHKVQLMVGRDHTPEQLREYATGLQAFGEFARELTAQRLAAPRDDLISTMLHENPHGQRLSPDEVVALIPTLIITGHTTLAQALAITVRTQLRSPGAWAALVDGTVPIPDLVEEGLRLDCPVVGMYRTTVREVTVADRVLPAGSRVLLLYGAGNRDPDRYPDPDRCLPGRRPAPPHLAFGRGTHYCVGAALARAELQIALEELADRFPALSAAPETTPVYRPTFPLRALTTLRVRP
ncbi:cytochrome P450 [Streptomyces sp. B-S-A8]|uniref:Cytochrome P450 n=1 Tax=Streptomyces solicavernae TaxID=3043614 RepID=A0ABT6S249_9ACTN|nr:cytochrome P450 [Streptomyces sp. B-S-A8]MDI3390755.1 cytochrome P450 [Streptomyces sp. B-S-A8]